MITAYVLALVFTLGVAAALWAQGKISFLAALWFALLWPLGWAVALLIVLAQLFQATAVRDDRPASPVTVCEFCEHPAHVAECDELIVAPSVGALVVTCGCRVERRGWGH